MFSWTLGVQVPIRSPALAVVHTEAHYALGSTSTDIATELAVPLPVWTGIKKLVATFFQSL